ncbi:MAG: malto-oligosyltrehalose synthase [Candidatus Omnitrophica bacterium]|nr:malto-oligosyltrehalose synthase [Candidatus Omnitrophota bacterium]
METPAATYRIQFTPGFGFKAARRIVPYLRSLGITHLYASPVFKAVTGSTHGYDVVDPTAVNPQLGSAVDFRRLLTDVRDRGMGWVQDIVPNHMAFNSENAWLMDLFEKGRRSAYAGVFDIEWRDTYQSLKGRLLAPFLGRFYSQCLEDQEIQLKYAQGRLTVNYYELSFPLRLDTYPQVLLHDVDQLERDFGADKQAYTLFRTLLDRLLQTAADSDSRAHTRLEETKRRLWDLTREQPVLKRFVQRNITLFNGQRGQPDSFNRLDDLLARQFFRLTFWKFGSEEINYRRFFNINQLISIRVEDNEVFEQTHRLVLSLINEGLMTGLRIDHIDGLYDPQRYLQRLRKAAPQCYIVAEKILEWDEDLPAHWPVQGTTGYQILNRINAVFVDHNKERAFDAVYQRVSGASYDFARLVSDKKRLIIGKHMAGDIENLAHHMKRISQRDRYGRDITLYGLKRALVEVMTYFPCYRTYVDSEAVDPRDRTVIEEALALARTHNPGMAYELDFISDILLLKFKDYLNDRERRRWVHFVKRFQQFTGPLMAKGFEDTTLYIYNRLLSLNEVGSRPDRFGAPLAAYHRYQKKRAAEWPRAMTATATHDTKRGEDQRARLNVLSEIPREWRARLKTWRLMNQDKKTGRKDRAMPDKNDEYFLYQALLGGWPLDHAQEEDMAPRLKEYMIKAVREAKRHTAWISPDEKYERACLDFIDGMLDPRRSREFLNDFRGFHKRVAGYGIYNSLAQTVLKLTVPGVPDFYQGTEGWDFSYVDPDNRRPVDFPQRLARLEESRERMKADAAGWCAELLKTRADGRLKQFMIERLLLFRNDAPALFSEGAYLPLKVAGRHAAHAVAFARRHGDAVCVVAVPRLLTALSKDTRPPLGKIWQGTEVLLPGVMRRREWSDRISGRILGRMENSLPLTEIFAKLPVAVLRLEPETAA